MMPVLHGLAGVVVAASYLAYLPMLVAIWVLVGLDDAAPVWLERTTLALMVIFGAGVLVMLLAVAGVLGPAVAPAGS